MGQDGARQGDEGRPGQPGSPFIFLLLHSLSRGFFARLVCTSLLRFRQLARSRRAARPATPCLTALQPHVVVVLDAHRARASKSSNILFPPTPRPARTALLPWRTLSTVALIPLQACLLGQRVNAIRYAPRLRRARPACPYAGHYATLRASRCAESGDARGKQNNSGTGRDARFKRLTSRRPPLARPDQGPPAPQV